MGEELIEDGDVSRRAESYLNAAALRSWQESIATLQSCEHHLPAITDDAQIVRRCCESIAKQACVELPRNVKAAGARSKDAAAGHSSWWYDDITSLSLYSFEKVMTAMAGQSRMSGAIFGGALELYARKWLPGALFKDDESYNPSRVTELRSRHNAVVEQEDKKIFHRFVVEKIVRMLPHEKDSAAGGFLLRLLRAACMFDCSAECRMELEFKAGQQLDQASLRDLLIPCSSLIPEYLYDVDLVRRLLHHFMALEQGSLSPTASRNKSTFFNKRKFGRSLFVGTSNATKPGSPKAYPSARLKAVSKLIDSYLGEVARDRNLPLDKFNSLAEAVPASARLSDDGLYEAIDTYLKIHTDLAMHEKKTLCQSLDCSSFSVAACIHAAQNERLPLCVVVQVLCGEQLKLRGAVTGIAQISVLENRATSADVFGTRQAVTQENNSPDLVLGNQRAVMLQTANQMQIRALQQELSALRIKCSNLERNRATMMELIEKLPSKPARVRSAAPSRSHWNLKKAGAQQFRRP